jgi:hypothetical protein
MPFWVAPYTFTESGEQNIIGNMLQTGTITVIIKKLDKNVLVHNVIRKNKEL